MPSTPGNAPQNPQRLHASEMGDVKSEAGERVVPAESGNAAKAASLNDADTPSETYEVRIADEFVDGLATIYSPRVLGQIENLIDLLRTSPELGSAQVRVCLKKRYGDNLRKIPVSTFVIVYRFDGITVDVLALVYGPTVV